jgi:hypothetical protein
MTVPDRWRPWLLLLWIFLLSFFFAQVEIQIEGAAGWAKNLPTWRIDHHWLLDLFWSGRPMTGYHAWVVPFMALAFHLPALVFGRWSWRLEARTVAMILFFWTAEDVLWFVLNPAFGWDKFTPAQVPWHKRWWLGAPADYWIATSIALTLFIWSYRRHNT